MAAGGGIGASGSATFCRFVRRVDEGFADSDAGGGGGGLGSLAGALRFRDGAVDRGGGAIGGGTTELPDDDPAELAALEEALVTLGGMICEYVCFLRLKYCHFSTTLSFMRRLMKVGWWNNENVERYKETGRWLGSLKNEVGVNGSRQSRAKMFKFRTDVTKLRKLLWRVLRLRYQELPSVILLSSLNAPSILRHLASLLIAYEDKGIDIVFVVGLFGYCLLEDCVGISFGEALNLVFEHGE
jgi:hypothetical protein